MLKLSAKFDNVYMVEDCTVTRTGESQSSQQIKLRLNFSEKLKKLPGPWCLAW